MKKIIYILFLLLSFAFVSAIDECTNDLVVNATYIGGFQKCSAFRNIRVSDYTEECDFDGTCWNGYNSMILTYPSEFTLTAGDNPKVLDSGVSEYDEWFLTCNLVGIYTFNVTFTDGVASCWSAYTVDLSGRPYTLVNRYYSRDNETTLDIRLTSNKPVGTGIWAVFVMKVGQIFKTMFH